MAEDGVHRLHDRDALIQRHQWALQQAFAQAAGNFVGLVPEAATLMRRVEVGSLSLSWDERERGRRIEVAVYLDAGVGTDDRPAGRALGKERAGQDCLCATRIS